MPYRSIVRSREEEAGSVIIEFALTLPLLLLVIIGIFDFGFAFREKLLVTSAAREGARMAVLPSYTTDDVTAHVVDYLTARGVTGVGVEDVDVGDVPITPGTGDSFVAKSVTVRVEYPFAILAPLAAMFGGPIGIATLEETSVMRPEIAAAGGP